MWTTAIYALFLTQIYMRECLRWSSEKKYHWNRNCFHASLDVFYELQSIGLTTNTNRLIDLDAAVNLLSFGRSSFFASVSKGRKIKVHLVREIEDGVRRADRVLVTVPRCSNWKCTKSSGNKMRHDQAGTVIRVIQWQIKWAWQSITSGGVDRAWSLD